MRINEEYEETVNEDKWFGMGHESDSDQEDEEDGENNE